jgi:hypothetical protein
MKVFLNDIESFVGDFIFVIFKAFGRGFQFPKWAMKDYI